MIQWFGLCAQALSACVVGTVTVSMLFFLSPASPHAYLFGYLPLLMLLLRALNACISFLLLILLGCRLFCPVCLCSFCFASLPLTVVPLLIGAQLWSLVVSFILFVLLHALLLFSTCVPLFPFCMLLVFCLNFRICVFRAHTYLRLYFLPCSSLHHVSMLLKTTKSGFRYFVCFLYAGFYDTSMGHYTWYLVTCNELSHTARQSPLKAGMKSALITFSCLFASRFPCARA
jgi:hypothetical protein